MAELHSTGVCYWSKNNTLGITSVSMVQHSHCGVHCGAPQTQTWSQEYCSCSRTMADVLLHLEATAFADSLPTEMAKLVVWQEQKGYCRRWERLGWTCWAVAGGGLL